MYDFSMENMEHEVGTFRISCYKRAGVSGTPIGHRTFFRVDRLVEKTSLFFLKRKVWLLYQDGFNSQEYCKTYIENVLLEEEDLKFQPIYVKGSLK